jgi:hypothetical protein
MWHHINGMSCVVWLKNKIFVNDKEGIEDHSHRGERGHDQSPGSHVRRKDVEVDPITFFAAFYRVNPGIHAARGSSGAKSFRTLKLANDSASGCKPLLVHNWSRIGFYATVQRLVSLRQSDQPDDGPG